MTVADLKRLMIVTPDVTILREFDRLVSPIQKTVFNNNLQVQTLTQLRDTLLPKLISGEVRLPEAEALVEEAVGA